MTWSKIRPATSWLSLRQSAVVPRARPSATTSRSWLCSLPTEKLLQRPIPKCSREHTSHSAVRQCPAVAPVAGLEKWGMAKTLGRPAH